MKIAILLFLYIVNTKCHIPFANPIVNIVDTAVNGGDDDSKVPYAKDIVQIVKDAINLGDRDASDDEDDRDDENSDSRDDDDSRDIQGSGRGGKVRSKRPRKIHNKGKNPKKYDDADYDDSIEENDEMLQLTSKSYKKTKRSYTIDSIGVSSPIAIGDLAVPVKLRQIIRATYFLKVQTSHVWYGPSFGFLLPNVKDTLVGTALWPTDQNGRKVTMYSFMSADPRFYSNQKQGIVDSELAIDTNSFRHLPSNKVFNTIKIDIEYRNLGRGGNVILEMNRDLYDYAGHMLTILPGSSVVWETYN